MKTRLVSYRGGRIDLAFPLQGKRMTIGRETDNSIQLPHEKISKHHAAVVLAKEGWTIEDLQSKNGVLVNGQKVGQALLRDGDTVKIGPYEFYFEANVPSDTWVPSHIVNFATKVHQQTLSKDKR